MAKIKLMLDTRRSLADGTFPVKLSVFINNKGRAIISLGVSVLEKQWNGIEDISHPMKARYNTALRYRANKADDVLMAMELSGELDKLAMPQIKERIIAAINGITPENTKTSMLIASAFEAFIESAATEGTKSVYRQTVAKLSRLYDLDTLSFNDINPAWLREFEGKMRTEGLAVNGIGLHLRNLRAVFNRALDDEVIEDYPFRKFKIKTEKTRKRSLTSIFDLLKTGCQWRMLPSDFSRWEIVYYYFQKWSRDGALEEIHEVLRNKLRRKWGRKESPSVGIID